MWFPTARCRSIRHNRLNDGAVLSIGLKYDSKYGELSLFGLCHIRRATRRKADGPGFVTDAAKTTTIQKAANSAASQSKHDAR